MERNHSEYIGEWVTRLLQYDVTLENVFRNYKYTKNPPSIILTSRDLPTHRWLQAYDLKKQVTSVLLKRFNPSGGTTGQLRPNKYSIRNMARLTAAPQKNPAPTSLRRKNKRDLYRRLSRRTRCTRFLFLFLSLSICSFTRVMCECVQRLSGFLSSGAHIYLFTCSRELVFAFDLRQEEETADFRVDGASGALDRDFRVSGGYTACVFVRWHGRYAGGVGLNLLWLGWCCEIRKGSFVRDYLIVGICISNGFY